MKVAIAASDNMSFAGGISRALNAVGVNCVIFNGKTQALYDVMDEFNPDVLITRHEFITESAIDCLTEYKNTHVLIECDADNQSRLDGDIPKSGRNVITFCSSFSTIDGIVPWLRAADVFKYGGGTFQDIFKCDAVFVGNLQDWFMDWIRYLCRVGSKVWFRIFGFSRYEIRQYCGVLMENEVKNAYASSKSAPIYENPNSKYISERLFYSILANGAVICNDRKDLVEMFDGFVKFVDKIADYEQEIINAVKSQEAQKWVMSNHTYFDRIKEMFVDIMGLKLEGIENAKSRYSYT